MAMRRDQRQAQEANKNTQPNDVVKFPKPGPAAGVRPEMMELVDQILDEDRQLFERLAAYDRGEKR